MHLLVVNWQDLRNPNAGGAEVHLHEIFGRLARGGHRIDLLVSGWRGCRAREEVDGLLVHRVGTRHTFPLHVRRAYRRLREVQGFDAVVEDVNKLPLFTPLWAGVPVALIVPHLFGGTAFREAGWIVASIVWVAERAMPRVYRRVPVQAISHSTAADLEQRGFGAERLTVVYPGVDHRRFRPDPACARFAEPTAVYVGRLKRYKQLDVVLRALRILRGRGLELRLLVAGRGDDERRLKRLNSRWGLADLVTFLGYVDERRKVDLLRRAWVAVYPSPKEGWGIANVEAAACGTPVVASDAPGLRESVAEGESGHVVPHADPVAWADALERICTDAEERRRLGEGAVRHAARFSWDRAAIQTEEWLRGVVRDHR